MGQVGIFNKAVAAKTETIASALQGLRSRERLVKTQSGHGCTVTCTQLGHRDDEKWSSDLEPLAEVEGALLVVEVLHAPHPELGGLLLVGSEHFCAQGPA